MNQTIEREIESESIDPCPTVNIKNIGPIENLALPIPPEGGVVILKGRNGAGKSKALEATQALVRGNGSLSVRDRQLSGAVEGFGAKITVGRSTRRTGELECLSLEGRLDIAALVDPGMKDAAAADARRIKSLVALTGAQADANLFESIFPDRDSFEAAVSKSSMECADLLEMAAKIKRDIEAAARKAEDDAAKHKGHAQGLMGSINGIDLNSESDSATLNGAYVEAVEKHAALKRQAEAFTQTAEARERAKAAIEKAEREYVGPTYTEATDAYRNVEKETTLAEEKVQEASRALIAAQKELDAKKVELRQADEIRFAALQHKNSMDMWRAEIDQPSPVEDVSLDQLAQASASVTAAREAVEIGAKVRDAIKTRDEAENRTALASLAAKEAARLREAAKSVDEVLSQAVASDVLRVEAGRLVLETPERGQTFFAELSHGQRWKIAIDLAAERVGVGGLIVVEQEAWESLDPANRQFVADHAQRRRVVIVTAEATDGALRAEVYEGEAA